MQSPITATSHRLNPLQRSFQSLAAEEEEDQQENHHKPLKQAIMKQATSIASSLVELQSIFRSASGREFAIADEASTASGCGKKRSKSINDLMLVQTKTSTTPKRPLRNNSSNNIIFRDEDYNNTQNATFQQQRSNKRRRITTGSAQNDTIGEEKVKEAEVYCALGNVWKDWGNHEKAVEYYERALLAWITAKGSLLSNNNTAECEIADLHVAGIYSVMEDLCSAMGDNKKSMRMRRAALTLLGGDDKNVSSASENSL